MKTSKDKKNNLRQKDTDTKKTKDVHSKKIDEISKFIDDREENKEDPSESKTKKEKKEKKRFIKFRFGKSKKEKTTKPKKSEKPTKPTKSKILEEKPAAPIVKTVREEKIGEKPEEKTIEKIGEKPEEKTIEKIGAKPEEKTIEVIGAKPEEKPENPLDEPSKEVKPSSLGTVEEKTGFGWKGLGSRRIFYDKRFREYRYEITEPILNETEIDIKDKLVHLFRVRADVDVFETDKDKKMQHLEEALNKIIEKNQIELDIISKDKIFYFIFQEFVGYGKIDIMMNDEEIEDISCDGENIPIFIYHQKYESIKSNVVFNNADELNSFVVKLSQMCGKQLSVYEPVVDGKLNDGSRLQTTLAKTITKKSTFTIRRFREDPLTPIDLISNHTMSIEMAAYFWMAIEHGASVLFCGGTASGKTTMLNALSLFLPSAYKIVSVEDTREINLPHENWIAGTTRTGFSSSEQHKTGKDIDMFDLIRVALRQRPRAIIVGEVRGREAYALFQAMTTGHLSYSTIHASDMHSLILRLESPPISLPRALLTSLDMVIFLNNLTVEGKPVRRITNVTEIIKLDPETSRLVTMSPYNWISEIDDRFETSKSSRMLTKIKLSNSWDDERIDQEMKNRIKVLEWMIKKKFRSYKDVGIVISYYYKDPEAVLKKVKDKP